MLNEVLLVLARFDLVDNGQVLRVSYVKPGEDEGSYECQVKNEVGVAKARGLVQLRSSADQEVSWIQASMLQTIGAWANNRVFGPLLYRILSE